MDWKTLAHRCVEIAIKAGEAIERIAKEPLDVKHKQDSSPVTQADLKSETLIKEAIQRLAGVGFDVPILSEESVDSFDAATDLYWCIDPLDGTKEFIHKTGDYTVNIALIQHGQPIIGVVHAPQAHVTYYAYPEGGAWKIGPKGAQQIQVRKPNPDHLTILLSRFHTDPKLLNLMKGIKGVELNQLGSAIKFCAIAEGRADLYPRLTPCRDWDVAAAHCVLRASGGEILNLDLQPIRYNKQDPWLIPGFLAVGSVDHPWESFASALKNVT